MNIMTRSIALLVILGFGIDALTQNGTGPGNKLTNGNSSSANQPTSISPQAQPASDEFVIGTGDLLDINVWKNPEISRVLPVRSDGKIALPLIGELRARGRTAKQLEGDIAEKLKDYIANPAVTVIVQEIRSQKIDVLGMVMHPGSFPLIKPMTVMNAIAAAGGFRDFAKDKDVYILRRDANGKQLRLPFNYRNVVKGQNVGQNIELEPNDTVIIP